MTAILTSIKSYIKPKHLFMISVLLVNAGNYIYNLVVGRILGPQKFADAAILITFLLVLSFIAMTFQLVTSKFSVLFEGEIFKNFVAKIYKQALIVGIIVGVLIVVFSSFLQTFFNTSSKNMFIVFGLGVPFYFMMSINRGVFQGKDQLKELSTTYQTEMMSRLVITLILLYTLQITSSVIIAIGIFCSFLFGLIPFKLQLKSSFKKVDIPTNELKMVRGFFIITAFYELTQIIINNSDIILVKHYFEAYEAGLYASLALIGRVVYFIAWMFVMLLLPTVVRLHKEGKSTTGVLAKYVLYIGLIALTITGCCYLFPQTIVQLLFGEAYVSMSPLLWKYAIATGVFAVSNIFAYYYLSLDKYIPVIISGLFGLLQVGLIVVFHDSLAQVVNMQIITMFLLLATQLVFFGLMNSNKIKDHFTP